MPKNHKFSLYVWIVRLCASRAFFAAIICIVVLQGIWFALSFQTGLFDEVFHFEFMDFYTHRINPFIDSQSPQWDSLGAIARNPNYLFYYLFSWPLRVIKLFTDSYFIQVLSMRLLFMSIFIAGLFAYRQLLFRLGASKALTHLTLLFLVLMPVTATFVSAINYDLVILLLVPVILLQLIDVIRSKRINAVKVLGVISLTLFASLMKFSFIPLMIPVLIYIFVDIWRKNGKQSYSRFIESLKQISVPIRIILIIVPVVLAGLLIERPVMNFVKYHRPTAPCTEILTEERCLSNYTARRNINFSKARPDGFIPLNPIEYWLEFWIPGTLRTEVRILPSATILPVMKLLSYTFTILGIALFLLYAREFLRNKALRVILIVLGIYIAALFANQYLSYIWLGQPAAISTRYLLPALPVLIYLVMDAAKKMLGRRHPQFLATLAIGTLFVLVTQGGGITTHLMTAKELQWKSGIVVEKINPRLEGIARRMVLERRYFQ